MLEKEGIVLKSTGSWYQVLDDQNNIVECRLKGKIRLKGIKSTNPVAVGDRVVYETENYTIKTIQDRKNYLVRRSNNLSKYSHVIAANIDLALRIISFKNPRTSRGFIDRFLLTCEAYSIPAVLVLNKKDELSSEEHLQVDELLSIYKNIGYQGIKISALSPNFIEEFTPIIQDKTCLVAGHSGVGKSTLINQLIPDLNLKIGDVSEINFKGKHTTTFAEMHLVSPNTYLIDSPGIKDFGLVHMEKEEESHYFREMQPFLAACKFSNCMHINEPKCAVLDALISDEIDPVRYQNYVSIIEGDDEINNPDYLWRKTL